MKTSEVTDCDLDFLFKSDPEHGRYGHEVLTDFETDQGITTTQNSAGR